MTKISKMPSQANIEAAVNIYKKLEGWNQANRVLSSYFENHLSNTKEECVVVKVVLVDHLYSTYLQKPLSVANHIMQLVNIDEQLKKGNIAVVDQIADFEGSRLLSFASKYSHFHNKAAFPLYDKYAIKSLAILRNVGFSVNSYNDFFEVIDAMRRLAELTHVSWEDIDKYLWLYGMKQALDEESSKVNKEVRNLYNTQDGTALFAGLEPSGREYQIT